MDYDLLERLLFEDEGPALDFKREQYRFVQASIGEKAELLKDILAFANAWRRSDAYILIGVEEVKGKRGVIHGVKEHLEDASLQQFVDKKTNRIVDFRYRARELDERQIGIIEIPLQERPTYLTERYGKLEANTVYIRRSSTTDEAPLEEVATMGTSTVTASPSPQLDLQFGKAGESARYGSSYEIECYAIDLPDASEIPSYDRTSYVAGIAISSVTPVNRDYYRDYADYLYGFCMLRPVQLVIENQGDVPLIEPVIRFTVSKDTGFVVKGEFPQEPSEMNIPDPSIWGGDVHTIIDEKKAVCEVALRIRNIHPKDLAWSDPIYFGAKRSAEITFEAFVYAENLPEPITIPLTVEGKVENVALNVDQIVNWADGKELGEE